jgi:hypothetical protein
MAKRESDFQKEIVRNLKDVFPGCIVIKNDARYIQGIPDLLTLYKDKWAALEVKRSKQAMHRPNQDHYIDQMNSMSYACFVYPENKEEIFDELRKHFYGTCNVQSESTIVA